MEDWIRKLHGKLVDKGVQVHLLTKYVDDVLIVVDTMDLGSRWTSEGICSTEETVQEDTSNCRSRQEVTFEVLKQAANEITPYLKFTGEASVRETGIPVLDTKIWFGDRKGGHSWYLGGECHGKGEGKCLMYSFYSKSMTNPLGILKRSVLAEGTKVSTASAEILRRLKTFSIHANKFMVEETLIEYMDNLLGMGYSEEWRQKVLTNTIKGYRRILALVEKGDSTRNREGGCTRKKQEVETPDGTKHLV